MHTGTKVLPFQANSGQDPRIGFELRKKRRYEGAEKFAKKIEEVQREAKVVLVKTQENMRRYVNCYKLLLSLRVLLFFSFYFIFYL